MRQLPILLVAFFLFSSLFLLEKPIDNHWFTHTHATVDEMLTLTCTVAQSATKDQSDGSVILSFSGGSAPYAVSWFGPQNGNTVSAGEGNLTISNLPAGDYIFNVNSNGENATCSINIPEKQTINTDDCITLGDDLPSTSPEGDTYCYKWSPTTYFDSGSNATDKVITACPTNNITYTVTVTDGLNITETREYEIVVEGGGNSGDNCNFSISCFEFQAASSGQQDGVAIVNIDRTEEAEYEVVWSGASGGSLISDEEQVFLFNLLEGNYNVTVTNIDTDCSETCTLTIDDDEGCEVIGVNDVFVLDLDGNKTSVKRTINVKDDLLVNDKYPDGSTFELQCINQTDLTLNCTVGTIACSSCEGEEFIVEAFALGTYEFEYLIKGCGGTNLDKAIIKILVSNCHEEPITNCNLVRNGDFDCFPTNNEGEDLFREYVTGHPTAIVGFSNDDEGMQNSPDLLSAGEIIERWSSSSRFLGKQTCCAPPVNMTIPPEFGENAIGLFSFCDGGFNFGSEVLVIPLDPPIQVGEVVNIEMFLEASGTGDSSLDPLMTTNPANSCMNFNPGVSISFLTEDFNRDPTVLDPQTGRPVYLSDLCDEIRTDCEVIEIINTPLDDDGIPASIPAHDDIVNGNMPEKESPLSITNTSGQAWTHIIITPTIDCDPSLVLPTACDMRALIRSYVVIDDIIVQKVPTITANAEPNPACEGSAVDVEFEICNNSGGDIGPLTATLGLPEGYILLTPPAQQTIASIPAGECVVVTATVTIEEGAPSPGIVTLTVESEDECIPTLVEELEITSLSSTAPTITSSVSPNPTCEGGAVNVNFEVCNDSDTDIGPFTATLGIPEGYILLVSPTQQTINSIPAGECVMIAATVIVGVGVPSPGIVTLTVEGDCISAIMEEVAITPLSPNPPIELEKSVTCVGDGTFNVDLTVTNLTEEAGLIVEITDLIPFGTFMVTDPMDFSVSSSRLMLTTTLGIGSATFSYIMQSNDTYCGDLPARCAFAQVEGCSIVTTCPEIEDCRISELIEGFSGVQANCNDTDNTLRIDFNANATGSAYTHTWDFGDGNTGTGEDPMHTYAEPGVYVVTHTVSNGCEEAMTTEDIAVIICVDNGDFCFCPNIPTSARITGNLTEEIGNLPPDLECLEIYGRLTVDISAGISDIEQIVMDPGASIEVLSGNSLTITGSNLFSCQGMWQGIFVRSGASLIFKDNNIEDAFTAVRLVQDSRYDIQNNTFNRNATGLFVRDNPIGTAPLQGNTFTSVGNLKNGEQAGVGIYLDGVNGFFIGNQSSSEENQNTFSENIGLGIFVDDSQVFVYRGLFENINGGINGSAGGINSQQNSAVLVGESKFRQLRRGIDANGKIGVAVLACTFDEVYIGIADTEGLYNVEDNIINSARHGFVISGENSTQFRGYATRNTFGGASNAILVNGINNNLENSFFDNQIDVGGNGVFLNSSSNIGVYNNPQIQASTGIVIEGGLDNGIRSNTINASFTGIRTEFSPLNFYCGNNITGGNGRGFSFEGNCDNSTVSGNNIQTASTGLYCLQSAIIGQQPNTGNIWTGPFSNLGGFHENDDEGFVILSQFIVDVGTSPTHAPPSLFREDFIAANDCTASANISETDGLAARASFSDSTSNWESARYLWRKIEMQEEVLGAISPVDSFYLATQEQAIGQLQAVESYIAAASKIDMTIIEGWDTDFDTIEDWLSQISVLEVDYQNATSNAQREDIIQQRQTLTNQITQTVTDNVQERETTLAANRDNLNFAYQLNEQIIPSNSFAANEQFVNRLTILSFYDADFELEEADRLELLGIANECPDAAGSIVFRARSLYELLTDEEMDFDCE